MSRTYPYISETRKMKQPAHRCALCGETQADTKATLQINWFRGDDEVFYIHQRCIDGKAWVDVAKELFK